jgi:hypothetical protein
LTGVSEGVCAALVAEELDRRSCFGVDDAGERAAIGRQRRVAEETGVDRAIDGEDVSEVLGRLLDARVGDVRLVSPARGRPPTGASSSRLMTTAKQFSCLPTSCP